MYVRQLSLQSTHLAALKEFYHGRLGMPLAWEQRRAVGFVCGDSVLAFEAGEAAYYHFAFNIPSLAVQDAADWLESLGIPLLPLNGERIVPFPDWEAEAVYFHDPAGNIVEFIARRRLRLPAQGAFGIHCLAGISEIGWAASPPAPVRATLTAQMGVEPFWCFSELFCALGDDHGLFILVDAREKHWIPSMEPAQVFPFEATVVHAGQSWQMVWDKERLRLTQVKKS